MLSYFRPIINEKINHFKLNKVVELIGERYCTGYSLKEYSYHKIGIIKIRMEIKHLENVTISFSQIRSFLNPSRKKLMDSLFNKEKYYAKIPYSSHMIYKAILHIIRKDEVLLAKCRDMNLYSSKCFCKDAFIKNLYDVLIDKSGFIKRVTKKSNNRNLRDLLNGFQNLISVNCLEAKKVKL